MTVFTLQKAIITDTPIIKVDAGLKAGSYRFQLVVIDNEGNVSIPDERQVEIVQPQLNPIIDPPILVRPPIFRPPIDPTIVVSPPIFRPRIPINQPRNPIL